MFQTKMLLHKSLWITLCPLIISVTFCDKHSIRTWSMMPQLSMDGALHTVGNQEQINKFCRVRCVTI